MNPNPQPRPISSIDELSLWEEYENLGEIASGSFGKVIKVKQRFGYRQTRAIKQIQIDPINEQQFNQVKKLKALVSDHIVEYYGYIIENGELNIVMQFCTGNLRDQMKKFSQMRQEFPPSHILDLLTQVTSAMLTLNQNNIMHLDLKPENILFIDQKYFKLCDFGCSQIIMNISRAYHNVGHLNNKSVFDIKLEHRDFGTGAYISPEIQLNQNPGNNSCDVWALGIIIYQMIYKKHPIGLNKVRKVESSDFRKFVKGELPIQFEPRENYPIDILKLMLDAKPKGRISWLKIKAQLISKYNRDQAEFIFVQDACKSQILLAIIFANIIITIDDNIEHNANQFWKQNAKAMLEVRELLIKLGYLYMLKFNQLFQYKMKYKLKPKTLAEFKFMLEDIRQEALTINFTPNKQDGKIKIFEAQLKKYLTQLRDESNAQKMNWESVEKISVFIQEALSLPSLFCQGHKFMKTCQIFEIQENQ